MDLGKFLSSHKEANLENTSNSDINAKKILKTRNIQTFITPMPSIFQGRETILYDTLMAEYM